MMLICAYLVSFCHLVNVYMSAVAVVYLYDGCNIGPNSLIVPRLRGQSIWREVNP